MTCRRVWKQVETLTSDTRDDDTEVAPSVMSSSLTTHPAQDCPDAHRGDMMTLTNDIAGRRAWLDQIYK